MNSASLVQSKAYCYEYCTFKPAFSALNQKINDTQQLLF